MWMMVAFGALSFCVALAVTPILRSVAHRIGLVDKPDGYRKIHSRATPVSGGLAVLSACLITTIVALAAPTPWSDIFSSDPLPLLGLLLASVWLVVIGVCDDLVGLRGRQKLAGQAVAAGILMLYGLQIHQITLFGTTFVLGVVALPFTLFWLLGAINAVNLIDGADGVASTVGIILCLALGMMAAINGFYPEALIGVILAGALLGFLRYNFPPATIFLGDAGSMLIGLVAGWLAIRCALKGPATVALIAPLVVWAIPVFDSTAAILRRKLTGRSIYCTDRGHIHHCLQRAGCTGRMLVFWIGVLSGSTALGGLCSVWIGNELVAIITGLTVLATLISLRVFGHAEVQLLTNRLFASGSSLFDHQKARRTNEAVVRLQGKLGWNLLWKTLVDRADEGGLLSARLDVNVPRLQEGYHAYWERRDREHEPSEAWRVELPLVHADKRIGRLVLTGSASASFVTWQTQIADFLEGIEEALGSLLDDTQFPTPGPTAVVTNDWPVVALSGHAS